MHLLACSLLSAAAVLTADPQPVKQFVYTQRQMGVPFTLVLYSADEAQADRAAQAAFARVEELNGLFSDYDPESELMRLCETSGKPVKVSRELFEVLTQAVQLSRRTGGAFDVTVGPLVQLWRKARKTGELPSAEALQQARQKVGYQKMKLDPKAQTVELTVPGMRLDLGGIAKGYAADEALQVLKQHGIPQALVNGSGDIALGDPPPERDAWRIGIAPLDANAPPSRSLQTAGRAVATSGDAWQYVEIDGQRYSHIVDPRTGLGLQTRSSVTIVAPDGTAADSLASAVSVLPLKAALKLVDETKGTAAFIVRVEAGEVRTYASKRWQKLRVELREASDK